MKKLFIVLSGILSLFFVSCASSKFYNLNEFPVITGGDASHYIVLGEISASSSLSMSNDEFSRQIKNELSYEPQIIQTKFHNDNGNYGFIGKTANIKMNVFERSAALAEFKLIEIAKLNEADAVLCFQSETSVERGIKNTTINTYVSGYAVKIKPDSGYTIKLPSSDEPEAPIIEEAEEEASAEIEE